jgi:hypothetical protein
MADKDSGLVGLIQGLRNIDPDKKKGVRKGVVVDSESGDKSVKINPTLSNLEVKRYENIFKIFKKIVFPGEEAGRAGGDASAISKVLGSMNGVSGKKLAGESLGALGLVALAAEGLRRYWDEITTGLEGFFGETLPNVGVMVGKGLIASAKVLGKVGAKIFPTLAKLSGKTLLKAMRFLPYIGTIASFAIAYYDFKDGDYVGMGLNIISGLINLIPGVGTVLSVLLDGYIIYRELERATDDGKGDLSEKNDKSIISEAAGKIWGVISSKLRYLPIIGGIYRWGLAAKDFGASRWASGVKNLALGFLSFKFGDIPSAIIDRSLFGKGVATYEYMEGYDGKETGLEPYNNEGMTALQKSLRNRQTGFFEALGTAMDMGINGFFDALDKTVKEKFGPKKDSIYKNKYTHLGKDDFKHGDIKTGSEAIDNVLTMFANQKGGKSNYVLNPAGAFEDLLEGSILEHPSRKIARQKQAQADVDSRKKRARLLEQQILKQFYEDESGARLRHGDEAIDKLVKDVAAGEVFDPKASQFKTQALPPEVIEAFKNANPGYRYNPKTGKMQHGSEFDPSASIDDTDMASDTKLALEEQKKTNKLLGEVLSKSGGNTSGIAGIDLNIDYNPMFGSSQGMMA